MFSANSILFFFCLAFLAAPARAGQVSEVDFRADHYERDLKSNLMHMEGHTWIRYGQREVWADTMVWDTKTHVAVATGNVHMTDGPYEAWASKVEYNVKGDEATLDDATIVSGQLVITGTRIHKLNATQFEIDEGAYTNCNVDLVKDKGVGSCQFDWKVFGSHISMTVDGYAQIHDAIIYMSKLPVMYTPYFIFPVKSKRQSGFLMPSYAYNANLGSAMSFPYFIALGPWDDLTVTPTWWGKAGYHLGLDYRYRYNYSNWGDFNFFFNQYHFVTLDPTAPNGAPRDYARGSPTTLGIIGEWAVSAKNFTALGGRTFSRQVVNLVSDPYYATDYGGDLPLQSNLNWLRSQLSLTSPSDSALFTGEITHHQSLNVTWGPGVDNGSVTQLPTLKLSKTTTPVLGKYLSFEGDTRFDNFYRPTQYDLLPVPPVSGSDLYLRAGQRLQLEPRLLVNVPMPEGFQFQPMLTAGSLLYHFDAPTSQVFHREYIEDQLPLSMYLHRTLETGIPGFEHISHVFQPQVVFGSSLYQGATPSSPFFQGPTTPSQPSLLPTNYNLQYLSNPGWDILDQMVPYEYFQFNLINRFRRQTPAGGIERFLLFEVSEQWNLRTTNGDPRYGQPWEPLQALAQVGIGRISAQVQGDYNFTPVIDTTDHVVGTVISEWSTSLVYTGERGDYLALSTHFYQNSLPANSQQTLYLAWYKTLPWFFDIEGNIEYDLLHPNPSGNSHLTGYQLGFVFGSKPRSCWGVELVTGQNFQVQQPFLTVNFKLDFGMANVRSPL